MDSIYVSNNNFNHKIFPAIFTVIFSVVYYSTEIQKTILEKTLVDLGLDDKDIDMLEKFLIYQIAVIFYDFNQRFEKYLIIEIEKKIFQAMFEKREKLENIIGLPVLSRKFENDIFLNLKKKFAILERKRRKKYEDEEKAGDLVATQMQLLDISPELNFLLKGKKI